MADRYTDLADAIKVIAEDDDTVQEYVRTIVNGRMTDRDNFEDDLQLRFKDSELPGSIITVEDPPDEVGNTTNEVEYIIPVIVYSAVKNRRLDIARKVMKNIVNGWETLINNQTGGVSANFNSYGSSGASHVADFAATQKAEIEDDGIMYLVAETRFTVRAIFDLS